MLSVVIAIGVVLLLIIIFTILRVMRLVSVARSTGKKTTSTSNKINGILFMVSWC